MPTPQSNPTMSETIIPATCIRGEPWVPPDKSISHRAVLIGSITEGSVTVRNFLHADDCLATLQAMRMLGVRIEERGADTLDIEGVGLHGLKKPTAVIDCGNSGTTMRLIMGILAAQDFPSSLTGDEYLRRRPMARIIEPLRKMGATLRAQDGDKLAPIEIEGTSLTAISYDSPIASAQVKSAILLAGLYCHGTTTVREPYKSRDHTERMLHRFGGGVAIDETSASVSGPVTLRAREILVPGDISSASFLMAAALMLPGSEVMLRNIGLNKTRTGFLDVIRSMGAELDYPDALDNGLDEPSGDICAQGGGRLKAITVGAQDIPRLIDEIPIIAVMALHAEGTSVIQGAQELRVKETDRLRALATNLSALGARIEERHDGLIIEGPQQLHEGTVDSFGDHRTAMAMAIAGLAADGPVTIRDTGCVTTSFPGFFDVIRNIVIPR